MPAPNAIPATGAVTPAPLPKLKTVSPTKLAAEPTTRRTPITHRRSFSARGFHFEITALLAFLHFDRGGFELAERAAVQVQLIDGVHAISNHFSRKNLRTPQPDGARRESVGPGEGALVLGLPEDKIGQLVGLHDPAI